MWPERQYFFTLFSVTQKATYLLDNRNVSFLKQLNSYDLQGIRPGMFQTLR
jgi:hypothetical protein